MKLRTSAMLATLAALQAPPAAAGPYASIEGLWKNPSGSIQVRIAQCGSQLCGTVERASPAAEKDARDAGAPRLVGTELLRDYRQVAPGRWEGRVYVPDLGGTYSSHIVQITPNELKVSGCLVGGWFCKSQRWTRD
jgi:uncharacterized protein (DUF2147 family)